MFKVCKKRPISLTSISQSFRIHLARNFANPFRARPCTFLFFHPFSKVSKFLKKIVRMGWNEFAWDDLKFRGLILSLCLEFKGNFELIDRKLLGDIFLSIFYSILYLTIYINVIQFYKYFLGLLQEGTSRSGGQA